MTAGRSLLLQTAENQNCAADPADSSGFLSIRSNGCFMKPVCSRLLVRQKDGQNGFLDVEAVLGFGEDLVGVLFKDRRGDLLAAVGGQAVEEHRVGLCSAQQAARDLKAREIAQAAFALRCAGGGVPGRRHDHVGVLHALGGVGEEMELRAIFVGKHQHIGSGAVALRADAADGHPGQQTAHDEAVRHAASIADEAELLVFQCAAALPNGHQVGQHLAGVAEVSEAVDDGDGGVLGQGLHLVLTEGTDHDAVAVAAEHPGGVLDGLAAADLALLSRQEQGVAAQLEHTRLKGHPGAGGVLLKNHSQGLALQIVVGQAVLLIIFHLVSGIQNLHNISSGQVQQLQQVFFHFIHLISD